MGNKCSIFSDCDLGIFKSSNTECRNCCKDKIKSSNVLCKKTKKAWIFLFSSYENITQDDNRLYIVLSYITMSSLLHKSYRDIMIKYYSQKNISTNSLQKGKWLPSNMNLKSSIIEDIIETQNIRFSEKILHNDAIDFFTNDSNKLHRNKVAHNFVESLDQASSIDMKNCLNKMYVVLHFIVCLDGYLSKYMSFEERIYKEKIELFTHFLKKYYDVKTI